MDESTATDRANQCSHRTPHAHRSSGAGSAVPGSGDAAARHRATAGSVPGPSGTGWGVAVACAVFGLAVAAARVPAAHALGDVVVKVTSDGKLKLTGDAEANTVEIVPGIDPGSVEVSGLAETTINGSAAPVVLGGVERLSVDLAKGDDALTVRDVEFTSKAAIKLGSGTNTVLLEGIHVDKKAKVEGGSGEDSVTIRGNARFEVKLALLLGGGPDRIDITRIFCGNDLEIETEGGADTIDISATTMGSDAALQVKTAGGEDRMVIFDNDFEDNVRIELGDGDDDLEVEDCDFDEAVNLNGGGGHDELDNVGGNSFDLGEDIDVRGFEDID
jgi:hypothetical protein